MTKYKFPCGCEFDVVDDSPKACDGLPGLVIDYYNIPNDCPATWALIQTGRTKGIFQLENNLGKKWAKQLAPSNINEMSALISLFRPGCLKAFVDGKSMTEHYCDRKNCGAEVKYFHEALEPILKETYGVLCIHEDTWVSMADGTERQIKNVVINDRINSVNQKDFKTVFDICHDIKKSPQTSGVELTLENGYRIKLTIDHKIFTQHGPIAVKDLQQEDVIQVIVNQNSDNDKYSYSDISNLTNTFNNDKQIPAIIFKSELPVILSFLAGLFDSDGYAGIHKNGYAIRHFCSNNPQIINGVRKLLSLLGIESYIDNDYKHIYVNNTNKFDNLVGPYIKIKKLIGITTNAETYGSFPRSLLRERIYNLGYSCRKFCNLNNISRSSISKKGFANIKTAKSVGYEFGDISFMQVKKITPIENQVFYSISVKHTHNLIGNGIIISNCYQEQSMKIAQSLAGFTLQEADILRKAIGKKKADIMAKVKTMFIDGCKKVGKVTEEQAKEIFGWIQESQKYSFNASHGVGYGQIGYWSAYVKAHFPIHFFTAWLYYAHEKMKPQVEVRNLVSDTKYFDIQVKPPSLTKLYNGDIGHFAMDGDSINFGIGDIKKIGESHVDKVLTNVETVEMALGRKINEWTWYDFLIFFSDTVSQTVINGLVAAGATDYMGGNRSQKVHEYAEWRKLTQKERQWVRENSTQCKTLLEAFIHLLDYRTKNSAPRKVKIAEIIKVLSKPSFSTEDDAYFITSQETELLGVRLTCSKLDTCTNTITADTTCKEFLQGKSGNLSICVEITALKEGIIKKGSSKGSKMYYLTVEDETDTIDSVVVFPNAIQGNESIILEGNTVIITGKRDKKNTDSFILDNIIQI